MATYRHWSVSLWQDPDDVPHCRILSSDKTEWRLISATLCGWRRCFVADPLWLIKRIREEEEVWLNSAPDASNYYWTLIGNPIPWVRWYHFQSPSITPKMESGPHCWNYGTFPRITTTLAWVLSTVQPSGVVNRVRPWQVCVQHSSEAHLAVLLQLLVLVYQFILPRTVHSRMLYLVKVVLK